SARRPGPMPYTTLFRSGLVWNFAKAAEINHLHLDSGPTGTRAELALAQPAEFKVISLSNPDRLVIDLPGSRLASGFKLPAPSGRSEEHTSELQSRENLV